MPPTTTKDTANVDIDVGILYVAPLGTSEPTSSTSALDTAWREVGYTEEGSTFTTTIDAQKVEVAELLDPVKISTVSRESKVAFTMAQMNRQNLLLALNQGADGANNTTTVEPVDLASEVRVMVLWQSEQTGADQRRWLFRQCYNTGNLEVANRKAPQKRLMAVEFTLEKPSSDAAFAVFPSNTGEV